jgi:hypothetical protein
MLRILPEEPLSEYGKNPRLSGVAVESLPGVFSALRMTWLRTNTNHHRFKKTSTEYGGTIMIQRNVAKCSRISTGLQKRFSAPISRSSPYPQRHEQMLLLCSCSG